MNAKQIIREIRLSEAANIPLKGDILKLNNFLNDKLTKLNCYKSNISKDNFYGKNIHRLFFEHNPETYTLKIDHTNVYKPIREVFYRCEDIGEVLSYFISNQYGLKISEVYEVML